MTDWASCAPLCESCWPRLIRAEHSGEDRVPRCAECHALQLPPQTPATIRRKREEE